MEDAEAFLNEAQSQMDLEFKTQVVLPGDDVTDSTTRLQKKIRLGPGLEQHGESVKVVNAGVLRYRPPNRFWVDYNFKRYGPHAEDSVIGLVEDRNAEFYRVNIGGSTSAILPILSFDGASKRNRPNLQNGALVYARVKSVGLHTEPVLTCEATSSMTKKDWMTGQGVYGELYGGYTFRVSVGLAKKLLDRDNTVLNTAGNIMGFEIAIGVNGFVWLQAENHNDIILLSNAILNSESLTDVQAELMTKKVLSHSTTDDDE